MTKFTPGRWLPEFSESINVRANDRSMIALCTNLKGPHGGLRRDTNEVEANAHLIAAAPELYAALEAITEHLAGVMSGPLVTGAGVTFANGVEGIPTIVNARAALAKARGE